MEDVYIELQKQHLIYIFVGIMQICTYKYTHVLTTQQGNVLHGMRGAEKRSAAEKILRKMKMNIRGGNRITWREMY